jgi:hypothetical protein
MYMASNGGRKTGRDTAARNQHYSARRLGILVPMALTPLLIGVESMAIEKRAYEVVERHENLEIRSYPAAIVAEVRMEGPFETVGNEAFRILVSYISGNNQSRESIAMTAAVSQQQTGRKIAMTAPVSQQYDEGRYRITFTMPSEFTLETLPVPLDKRIQLREEPAGRFAAVRYSGFWSRKNYDSHLQVLRGWTRSRQLRTAGEPLWARYDPPFMPWFFRRNEILLMVES